MNKLLSNTYFIFIKLLKSFAVSMVTFFDPVYNFITYIF